MAGWLTNGYQNAAFVYGGEKFPVDTALPGGQNPQSEKLGILTLAAAMSYLTTSLNKTMVANTLYYGSYDVNAPNPTYADGGAIEAAPVATVTGVQLLVGGTGGTDTWTVELHDSAGNFIASGSATAGTASQWQQIAFSSTVSLVPGSYFLTLQSNGTTATFAAWNFPAPAVATTPLITGTHASNTAGSAFTPATTYTKGVAPISMLY